MYNITLISTSHSENGKCNSDELYKIIEYINPEVVFEELPNSLFKIVYNGNHFPDEPLEIKCIKKYLQNHSIRHIPVDIDVSPNLSKNEIDYMFGSFKQYHVYKEIEDEQKVLLAQEGFAYLNSEECSASFDRKKTIEKYLIDFAGFNKNQLSRIYTLFHEEHDKRENAMIQNIYNYSRENQYNQAVFLIGSGHRKSITQKIQEYGSREELKLNWFCYEGTMPTE